MMNPDVDPFFHQLTLGLVKSLEKRPGVVEIKARPSNRASTHEIQAWEQHNSRLLDQSCRAFYTLTNGVSISWTILFRDVVRPLGRVHVNSLDEVEIAFEAIDGEDTIFLILDDCQGRGRVGLVYENQGDVSKGTIWFSDNSGDWHFIAPSLSQYFVLMVLHLGLPEWQYLLTGLGVSPGAEQWFRMYAPLRLFLAQGGSHIRNKMAQHAENQNGRGFDLAEVQRIVDLKTNTNTGKNKSKKYITMCMFWR
eukprot:m.107512 g.107512  ORF g.107512 m.107512 type:complete len:251 (-) comp13932_c0_seq15:775-1527(-)